MRSGGDNLVLDEAAKEDLRVYFVQFRYNKHNRSGVVVVLRKNLKTVSERTQLLF